MWKSFLLERVRTSTLFYKIIMLEAHSKCSVRMIRRVPDAYGRLGSIGQRKKLPSCSAVVSEILSIL